MDEIVRMLIGKRHLLGLSQRGLAREMGTSVSNVHYWEAGAHDPSLANLRAWAAALGYNVELHRPRPACSCGARR